MQSDCDTTADPGRRRFVKQAAAASLLTAVASRFPIAYGESTEQRGKSAKRTILMNGSFATLDPAKPRATAVAIKNGVFEAVGGEYLVWSAADFENFLQPRPQLVNDMNRELERITRLLVENRWPFRIHATYDESISQFLDVFERVNKDIPFDGLRFVIDHAETIRPASIERIKALGGGIAIQHRMAFQGEYFVQRYGATEAQFTPPVTDMLAADIPVGAGTDATRVASFNPWVALYWLVTGKTLGGLTLYPKDRRLDRKQALSLWTKGSAWFSGEQDVKGAIAVGQYADLAVLSADYFSIPAEDIKDLTSVLTMVGGEVVHGTGDFSDLAPPLPPPSPDWSPIRTYGGHYDAKAGFWLAARANHRCLAHGHHRHSHQPIVAASPKAPLWGAMGCSCFAF